MPGLLDALASAEIAKEETLYNNALAATLLTKTIRELTATNQLLVKQLTADASNLTAPPGIVLQAPPNANTNTANCLNTAGVACPVNK